MFVTTNQFAQGGLAAYANGGSSFFNPFDKGELQRQNKLISERAKNRTPEETQAAFEALTPEEKARISDPYDVEGFNKSFKENIFDYEDPVDYATLPFLSLRAAKLAGKAGKKVYDTVRGSGGKLRENLRGIGAYVGADMIADEIRDDSDPFFTKQDDGTYVSTRPNIEDDALDQATEDLDVVNANEDAEEKEKTLLEKLSELSELGGMPDTPTMSRGFMIEGSGISTPEIRRYEGGGIANIMPIGMAEGGSFDFSKLSSLGGMPDTPTMTPGSAIASANINTPEIKKGDPEALRDVKKDFNEFETDVESNYVNFAGGGIANMDPMMMAAGGIANYSNEIPGYFLGGLAKIGKGATR